MVGDTVLKSPIKVHEQKLLTRPKHFIDAQIATFNVALEDISVPSLLSLQPLH